MRQLILPSLFSHNAAQGRAARSSRGAASARRAAKTRKTPPRRRVSRWRPRSLRQVALAGFALAVLVAGAAAWRDLRDGFGAALLAWSGHAGIAVGDVLVVGRVETPARQILNALDVHKGSPLLAFSPAAARERLLKLGWVKDARVERRFPDTVFVRLEERRPAAIWQNAGRLALVDESGAVIGGEAVPRFPSLRVIVGPDAPDHFAALFVALATRPEMLANVMAAVRVGGRRWNLRLSNGMTVLLPERDVATAWQVLADAVRDNALLDRDIVHIDLRIPDRLVLRLAPGAAQRRGDGRGA